MKPRLLVVVLWGLGDLVIATPFLRAASARYAVTLLARPNALDLQARFFPEARFIPFVAPWTAFRRKYRLLSWPWLSMFRLGRMLAAEKFAYGVSAHWDPRDHLLLRLVRARTRLGFPRLGSQVFLDRPLARLDPATHRYENWRVLAQALGFALPPRQELVLPRPRPHGEVLVHTGAGQPVRVWPLERYQRLVGRLRQEGRRVQVACDLDQREWWRQAGEPNVAAPRSVAELAALVDRAGAFIGNDSGPGHLAALSGVPTFTIFGPQLPDWWAPLHPASEWLEGKPCPYKPCFDYCRFASPCCLLDSGEEEVAGHVQAFLQRVLPAEAPARALPAAATAPGRSGSPG
jgi:heptosyltransferase-2